MILNLKLYGYSQRFKDVLILSQFSLNSKTRKIVFWVCLKGSTMFDIDKNRKNFLYLKPLKSIKMFVF